jgi:hypothetical protein
MPPPETENPLAVGAAKGASTSSDFSKRLKRYGTAKAHTAHVIATMGDERAVALGLKPRVIEQCGNWLKFRDYHTVGKVKLVDASFCKKHLVCSLCAIRRSARLMAAYLQRYSVIRGEVVGLSAHLVTLTVRNSHDLPAVLAHLLDSLRTLHRRRNRPNQPSIMHSIDAGVYSVELTHDLATGWHPHVHAIWLTRDSEISDQASTYKLRAEWEKITGDSFMCDIRPIQPDHDLPDDIDPHAGGFAEVFKYAMKPSELGADLLIEAYPYLRGRRLAGSFGWFRGVPEPEELTDDLAGLDDLPYEEFMARFLSGAYHRANNHEGSACQS